MFSTILSKNVILYPESLALKNEFSLIFPAKGHKLLSVCLKAANCQTGGLSILIVTNSPMIV